MLVTKVSSVPMANNVYKQSKATKSTNASFRGDSMWEHTRKNIENAAAKLELSKEMSDKVIYPERELSGFVYIKGYGPVQVFRTQHNTALGPAKGGIRMTSKVDADTVRALSAEMSLKNSLAGLPLGGGKGGLRIDPENLNPEQTEQLFRNYTRLIFPIIGIHNDIPAPDINTNGAHMDIIMDEYSKLIGHNEPGVVTGKSLDNFGSQGRKEATGLGVVFTVEEAVKDVLGKNSLKGVKCAVQGSGNVGGIAAKHLYLRGAKVQYMSDVFGAIYNPNGINVLKALDYISKNKSLNGFDGAERVTNEELLTADVDVLVPAATQGQINIKNADRIRAKIIAEGANGPTTPDADLILNQKGVYVVPDVLANQGGVYVSYLEYLQNIHGEYFDEDTINEKLSKQMKSRYREVVNFAQQHDVTNREAATMLAVSRIAKAMNARHK